MLYDELHSKYGNHIAKRVQQELSSHEFKQITVKQLIAYLEGRAENAHREYRAHMDNPFTNEKRGGKPDDFMDRLYRRWCDAEDLAYLLTVAEDVSQATRERVNH